MGSISPEDQDLLDKAIAKKSESLDTFIERYRRQSEEVGATDAFVAMTTGFVIALDGLSAIEYLAVAIKRLAEQPEQEPAQDPSTEPAKEPVGV